MTQLPVRRQLLEIAHKDLRIEGRTGEVLMVTVPFGALALLLMPLAAPMADLLALLRVDPAAIFLGRAAASTVLLAIYEAVLAPVAVVLYAPAPVPRWGWLLVVGALVASGLALTGTLAAELTAGLRARTALAPLLVAPLAVPLLLAATQVTESLRAGGSIISWVLLMSAMNVGLMIAGVLITGPLRAHRPA